MIEHVHDCPTFICYRRDDGYEPAKLVYDLLMDPELSEPYNKSFRFDVFLDKEVPGVPNFWKVHQPYLQKATAFILICTPGAKCNNGPEDWVHKEINWWLQYRNTNPILVAPSQFEKPWIPQQILNKWPNIQRISFDTKKISSSQEEKNHAIRMIVGAIFPSYATVHQQELKKEKQLKRNFRIAFIISMTMLIVILLSLIHISEPTRPY